MSSYRRNSTTAAQDALADLGVMGAARSCARLAKSGGARRRCPAGAKRTWQARTATKAVRSQRAEENRDDPLLLPPNPEPAENLALSRREGFAIPSRPRRHEQRRAAFAGVQENAAAVPLELSAHGLTARNQAQKPRRFRNSVCSFDHAAPGQHQSSGLGCDARRGATDRPSSVAALLAWHTEWRKRSR